MGEPQQAWRTRLLDINEVIPADESVSAVFLLAIIDDSILAVRNERGWDIPGGHVDADESPASAIARETLEEAGANFSWVVPFAIVGVPERREVMLFYTTSAFALSTFSPAHDALERAVMPLDQFDQRYCGPVELLDWLIEAARVRLARRA